MFQSKRFEVLLLCLCEAIKPKELVSSCGFKLTMKTHVRFTELSFYFVKFMLGLCGSYLEHLYDKCIYV